MTKKAPVPKSNDEILSLDLLGTGNTKNQQAEQNFMTFDQLLGSSNTTTQKKSSSGEYNDLIWWINFNYLI